MSNKSSHVWYVRCRKGRPPTHSKSTHVRTPGAPGRGTFALGDPSLVGITKGTASPVSRRSAATHAASTASQPSAWIRRFGLTRKAYVVPPVASTRKTVLKACATNDTRTHSRSYAESASRASARTGRLGRGGQVVEGARTGHWGRNVDSTLRAAAAGDIRPRLTSASSDSICPHRRVCRSSSSSVSVTSDHIQARACSVRRASSSPEARASPTSAPTVRHSSSMPSPSSAEHVRTRSIALVVGRAHEVQRMRVVGGGVPGEIGQLAVGLVDDDEVGELDDPALHALQLVAGARREQQHEQVDHAGDRDLRLADADGLDEHDVEAGRLAHEHRLAGAPRDAAERARPTATDG